MNKGIWLLVIILFAFSYIAHSISNFTIQETEKLSLEPNVVDPDADSLIIKYEHPLDHNGEWQTNYGDAGEYKTAITVSDGITSVSKDVLITVKKKEEPPRIESYSPEQDVLSINEAESINFKVLATDLNEDELSYEWRLDDEKSGKWEEFSYDTTYDDAGSHKVFVSVSDGTSEVGRKWDIDVADVDVESLLEGIQDITANENDVITLNLPDFEKYGLSYSISEPVGDKNEWKTGYSDAGSRRITVHAEGKGFSKDKNVNIVVNDVDRPLAFDEIGNKIANENEELKITLNANDPDGDEIIYNADHMPEGAALNGSIFAWKPSYDTVKKEGLIDRVLNQFGILNKNFYVQFTASSKDKKIVHNVIITVKDVNRAPVLEDIEPININEGDAFKIAPKAYDLDGDRVKLSYSGFINTDTFKSNFGDTGAYNVKVTASDGSLETSKFVDINIEHVNRLPIFGQIQEIKAREGDSIAILLNANDPDGDEITYLIDNPPGGSSLEGNAFLWTPDFSTAGKGETAKIDLVFVASDGESETRQIAKAEIADKNRPPIIINASKTVVARVNKPVLMFVKAIDEDEDDLSYTWNFGFLQKYKATSMHQRIFTTRGAKVVKVTVSDGIDEIEQIINVNVI
ncbi:Ig-like domain-containing protein [Candidatus Woesearchaeota archaeon]|nr:Ig-like domain-containing protein [Candidatus Woesearchaeota archaeon]